MTLRPEKEKTKKRKKTKWSTARGPIWAVNPPPDVEIHDGRPIRYMTKKESEAMFDELDNMRWERMERMRIEREDRKKKEAIHDARVAKEIPRLNKMTLKQLRAFIKKNGPIDLDFDMDRHDKYRTPENIIAARKMGMDVEDAGYYFERVESIAGSQVYSKKRYAFRQKVLNTMTAKERREANKAVGSITLKANTESSQPGYSATFESVDYLTEEELKELTPIKVEWDRDWNILNNGYRDGKPHLVIMSPEEFLAFAHTLHEDGVSDISIRTIKEGVRDENIFPAPYIYRGKDGIATGEHEGRHRARAFKELGIKKMPVLIFDEALKREELKEWSGAIELSKEYDDYSP